MSTVPTKKRRFMIPFTSEETDGVSILMLYTSDYQEALKIAKCVCGDFADKSLCYKDFIIYD